MSFVRGLALGVFFVSLACTSDAPPPSGGGQSSSSTTTDGSGETDTGDEDGSGPDTGGDGDDDGGPDGLPDIECTSPPDLQFTKIEDLIVTEVMGGSEDIDGNCGDGLSDPNFTDCRLESFALGVSVGDFDGDGLSDLFVGDTYGPSYLMRATSVGGFEDVGAEWGIELTAPVAGAAWFDADKDGDLDLYVVSFMGQRQFYYRNEGDHFEEVAAWVGLDMLSEHPLGSSSVAVGDVNLDGWPDLFVTGWRTYAPETESSVNRLFINQGESGPGIFDEISIPAGLELAGLGGFDFIEISLYGGFSPAFVDLDGDDYPDLIEIADYRGEQVFRNRGDLTFEDVTEQWGAGQTATGMGLAVADIDGDADMDWFATAIHYASGVCENVPDQDGGNRLYLNDISGPLMGVDVADDEAAVACASWGWGAAMADIDNDGDADIAATNGWFEASTPGQYYELDVDRIWINPGQPTDGMQLCAEELGFDDAGQGRSLVTLDIDHDGDLDFIETRATGTPLVYRNDGGDQLGASLRVSLRGRQSMTTGRGARIAVQVEAEGPWQVAEIGQASHFVGHSELLAHFGLGAGVESVHEVRVCWPVSKRMQKLSEVAVGSLLLDEDDADVEVSGQACASAVIDPAL